MSDHNRAVFAIVAYYCIFISKFFAIINEITFTVSIISVTAELIAVVDYFRCGFAVHKPSRNTEPWGTDRKLRNASLILVWTLIGTLLLKGVAYCGIVVFKSAWAYRKVEYNSLHANEVTRPSIPSAVAEFWQSIDPRAEAGLAVGAESNSCIEKKLLGRRHFCNVYSDWNGSRILLSKWCILSVHIHLSLCEREWSVFA